MPTASFIDKIKVFSHCRRVLLLGNLLDGYLRQRPLVRATPGPFDVSMYHGHHGYAVIAGYEQYKGTVTAVAIACTVIVSLLVS